MNAAFVGYERHCKQNKHDDEHDALFVLREFEDLEKAFHFRFGGLKVVILSEAKNLRFFTCAHQSNSQRCFASLNMTTL